jgi:hypothetical protein
LVISLFPSHSLSSSTGLFHRKKSKIEKERDNKSPSKGGSPEPKVKVQSPVTSEEVPEQKVQASPAKVPTPELLRKKSKDGAAPQGTKEKTKEVFTLKLIDQNFKIRKLKTQIFFMTLDDL